MGGEVGMDIYQTISKLNDCGVELSVVNEKLKARLPWQKDNIPTEAMVLLRQLKAMQNKLPEVLLWDKERAFGIFKAIVDKTRLQCCDGIVNEAILNNIKSLLKDAGNAFNAGMERQNMQLVISAVQAWETAIERCANGNH